MVLTYLLPKIFLALQIRTVISIKIPTDTEPYIGSKTNHQDQSITSVNFSVTKIRVKIVKNPIPPFPFDLLLIYISLNIALNARS